MTSELASTSRLAAHALLQERFLFHALLEKMPDRIYFKDAKSRFLKINPELARHFGLKDPEEAVGKTDFDFFAAEHAEQAFRDEQRVIKTGESLVGYEEKETWRDGSVSWVSTTKLPLRDSVGQVVGTFGISRDITDKRNAMDELRVLAERLAAINKELEEFAYMCSHDLQEPLRKIRAFGDRLKSKCHEALSDEGRDFLERMLGAASRMQQLIDSLLTYSRVTTQGQSFSRVDLNRVLADVVSDLELRIEEGGAIDVGPLPVCLVDEPQMRQLFQNLLGNGLKFRHPDRLPEVRVRAEGCAPPAPGNDGAWKIVVEDNGIGFDPKYLDKLFVPFSRLHGKFEYAGTGIGLAVCRKIMQRHAGSICAEGVPGQGARFVLTLPLSILAQPL
jgi:PAS domain S-box-containing protein